jgi:hypothetical protein
MRALNEGEEMLYARLATGSILPTKIDEAIALWQGEIAPSAKQQKGFKNACLLVDRETGKMTSIGFWENEIDLHASKSAHNNHIYEYNRLFLSPPIVEQYEVTVEA